jgi:hypothetical protein
MTDREVAWGMVMREVKRHPYYICLTAERRFRLGQMTRAQVGIIEADVAALRARVFEEVLPDALWPLKGHRDQRERLRFARLARRGWGDLYEYPLGMQEEMDGWGWRFREGSEKMENAK